MATEIGHIQCANRTQQTINHLLSDRHVHSPWIATAAFYKALHVVEAVFATNNIHGASHSDRDQRLKKERKYQNIAKHYFELQRASTNARYLTAADCFDDYLSPDDVVEKLLKHHLCQLEKSAMKFLRQGGELVGVQ